MKEVAEPCSATTESPLRDHSDRTLADSRLAQALSPRQSTDRIAARIRTFILEDNTCPPTRTSISPSSTMTEFLSTRSSSTPRPGSRWADARALSFTPEFIHETFGMTNPSIFRRCWAIRSTTDLQRYSDLKEVCYRDVARGKIQLMDGVRERPRRSDGPRCQAGDRLERRAAQPRADGHRVRPDGRFAAIASLEDITHGKPDPAGLPGRGEKGGRATRRVRSSSRMPPVGIQAAKAAGMYAVGV